MRVRDPFLLDPEVAFLNHGSYGACPRPVFEAYQEWQRELERQPVEFLARRLEGVLADARAELAGYVGASAENLVFVPNATSGLNAVLRSLGFEPGDEVLTTAHEYGALVKTWEFVVTVLRPSPRPALLSRAKLASSGRSRHGGARPGAGRPRLTLDVLVRERRFDARNPRHRRALLEDELPADLAAEPRKFAEAYRRDAGVGSAAAASWLVREFSALVTDPGAEARRKRHCAALRAQVRRNQERQRRLAAERADV